MLPDLSDIGTEALAAVEAGKRLGIVGRAGKGMKPFGTASVDVRGGREFVIGYLLEVFRTEVQDWCRAEGYCWGDWIVRPMEHRSVCAFSVVDDDEPDRSREFVIEYELERCVTSGDWSVNGYAMARVDGRALDALAVSA